MDLYPYIFYWYFSIFFLSYLFFLFFHSLFFFQFPFLDLERGICRSFFRVLGGLESIYDLLILRGVLWTLNKNSLRSLCVWAHEKQIIFCMIVALSGWHHHHLRSLEVGRGGCIPFFLNSTLLNLEVYNSTLMRLKLSTRSDKIIKKQRCKLTKEISFTFSSLSLNNISFMVLNLGFGKIQLSLCSSNCF